MTVRRIAASGAVARFLGESTDIKPRDATIPAGAEFWETNTGNLYRYDGAAWVPFAGLPAAGTIDLRPLLAQILAELRRLRSGHEQLVFRKQIPDPGS